MNTDNLTEEQMRVECAERIGWTKIGSKGFGSDALVGADPETPTWNFTPLPNFTRDLNDAWKLVEWMRERGWVCQMNNGLDSTWECTFFEGDHRSENYHYGAADTLALAIVKAFLTAQSERTS